MSSNSGAGPRPVAQPGKSASSKFDEIDAKYADKLDSMTMTERGLLGLPYLGSDSHLTQERIKTRNLLRLYNNTPSGPASAEEKGANDLTNAQRRELLGQIFNIAPEPASRVFIEPPFWCHYGTNIHFEGDFYCNFNCTFLDCAEVKLGHGVLVGPNVQIYAATHSISVAEREQGYERALSVSLGRNTWVGGNAVIMSGVQIGEGCTIGAGSVVTRDIPDWSIAVGNPARIVRILNETEKGRRDGSSSIPF